MNLLVRVVFDVNVLFSWVGWHGVSYRCVELARQPHVVSISCEAIVRKLCEKLAQKLRFTPTRIADVVQDLLSFTTLITLPAEVPNIAGDPEDDIVLACAVHGAADYIVSGDKKHLLILQQCEGKQIVSPSVFLLEVVSHDNEPANP